MGAISERVTRPVSRVGDCCCCRDVDDGAGGVHPERTSTINTGNDRVDNGVEYLKISHLRES